MHAPIKRKLLRANHVPYTTKVLKKAILKRFEFENKYVKNKTSESLKSYKNHSFCGKLYKKERKKCYDRLDLKNVTDNQEFWKTVKSFFFDKVTTFPKIEKREIIKVANS